MEAMIVNKTSLFLTFPQNDYIDIEMSYHCDGGIRIGLFNLSTEDIKALRKMLDELESNIKKPIMEITYDGEQPLSLKRSNLRKLKAYMKTVKKE